MTGTTTLWVFGLLCFVVAFAKQAASGAGISLPGPETRGARVGVVLVGVLALVLGAAIRPGPDGPAPAVTLPTNSTNSAPRTASTADSSPATAPASSNSTPAWSGAVGIPTLTDARDLEFDRIPPAGDTIAQSGIYSAISSTSGKAHLRNAGSGHNQIGVWSGKTRPTGAECSTWAATHPGSEVEVTAGTMVCLKTEDGHTALLVIDPLPTDGGPVTAVATVWAPS